MKTVNEELKALAVKQSTADWIKSTDITEDTERASAWANDEVLASTRRALEQARSASTGLPSTRTPPG